MRTDTRAYLQLTGAMVLVGSSVVAGKLMAESLPVFLAGGLSSSIGAVILLSILIARERGLPAVGRREILVLFLQAFTGIFLFRVLLLWGLLFKPAHYSAKPPLASHHLSKNIESIVLPRTIAVCY